MVIAAVGGGGNKDRGGERDDLHVQTTDALLQRTGVVRRLHQQAPARDDEEDAGLGEAESLRAEAQQRRVLEADRQPRADLVYVAAGEFGEELLAHRLDDGVRAPGPKQPLHPAASSNANTHRGAKKGMLQSERVWCGL